MEFNTSTNQIIETFVDGSLTLSEVIKRYEISEIIRRFGQWVVTDYGLESLVIQYQIPKERFNETDWVSHMGGKKWVILDEFETAFKFAQEQHHTESEIMPEILPPSKDEIFKPFADYYTAKKLCHSLICAHETYNAVEKYVPDDLPRLEDAPASFSVKEDFILSPAYTAFAYLFDSFLLLVNRTYLLQQFDTETLLKFSSRQFKHWINQILNQAYEAGL